VDTAPLAPKKDPLGKLDRIAEGSAEVIEALVKKRRDALQLLVLRASKIPNIATNAAVRERLYRRIDAEYGQLNDAMNGRLEKIVGLAAQVAHEAAIDEAGEETVPDDLIKYDHARTEAYVQLVSPANDDRLAAVFTDQMTEKLVQKLRNTHRDNFHEAKLNGWTMRETNKHLQEKWADVAADGENFQFVDKGDRKWDDGVYAQMLTRTTAMRVANAEAIDTAKALGRNLLQISGLNDKWTCEHCAPWAGQIVTFEGRDTRFPGVEDAEDDGVFHPNCRHRLLQVDVDFDEEEIAKQAGESDEDNMEKIDKEYGDKAKPFSDNPTEKDRRAIQNYTGSGYGGLNYRMNKGTPLNEQQQKLHDDLLDVIEKAPEQKLKTYRSESYDKYDEHYKYLLNLKEGKRYETKAFTSTSLSSDIKDTGIGMKMEKKVRMTIYGRNGAYIAPWSEYDYEKEVLYAPGSKFKVLQKSMEDGILNLVLKEL